MRLSSRLKNLLVVVFVSALFLCSLAFKKPLIDSRYLECFDSALNLNSLELFSHAACVYSWYSFAFFNLFTYLPLEYYRIILISVFFALFLINIFTTFKISRLRKVNFAYLLLLTFLFFDFSSKNSLIDFTMLALFNLSLLFYLLNTRPSLFLCGFFGSLPSILRPHPSIFIFVLIVLSLIDSFSVSRKKSSFNIILIKKKVLNSLLFIAGFCIIPLTYFFNSANYFKATFMTSIRMFDLTNFNFKFLLYLLVFICVFFNKNKSSLHKAFLIMLPFVFYISLLNGMGSRYLDFLSLLAPLLLLEDFKKNKLLIISLIILLIVPNWLSIFRDASIFEGKDLFENQLLLLNKSKILTDLNGEEYFNLKHNVYPLIDYWIWDYLYPKGFVSFEKLRSDLINITKDIDLLIIGPTQYESRLISVVPEFNSSQRIFIPTLDHDCSNCRHVATLYFRDTNEYNDFKSKLITYWSLNYVKLCQLNGNYYNIMLASFYKLMNLPLCSNKLDLVFISDYTKNSYNSFLMVALTIIIIAVLLKKLLRFKLKFSIK